MHPSQFEELLKFYEKFINQENKNGFSGELRRWQTKWQSIQDEERPTNVSETLKRLGPEGFVSRIFYFEGFFILLKYINIYFSIFHKLRTYAFLISFYGTICSLFFERKIARKAQILLSKYLIFKNFLPQTPLGGA